MVAELLLLLLIPSISSLEPTPNEPFRLIAVVHNMSAAHDVRIRYPYAYVAGLGKPGGNGLDGKGLFAILNISDISSPSVMYRSLSRQFDDARSVLLPPYHMPANARTVLVGARSFSQLNLSDPYMPHTISHVVHPPQVDHLNGLIWWDDLHVIGVSMNNQYLSAYTVFLTSAQYLGARNTETPVFDVDVYDQNHIVTAGWLHSNSDQPFFQIWVVSSRTNRTLWNPSKWRPISSLTVRNSVNGHFPKNSVRGANRVRSYQQTAVYIGCARSHDIIVVDVRNRHKPEIVRVIQSAGVQVTGLIIVGKVLWAGSGRTLQAFNISEPLSPTSLGYCKENCKGLFKSPGQNAHTMDVYGKWVIASAQIDDMVGVVEILNQDILDLMYKS